MADPRATPLVALRLLREAQEERALSVKASEAKVRLWLRVVKVAGLAFGGSEAAGHGIAVANERLFWFCGTNVLRLRAGRLVCH